MEIAVVGAYPKLVPDEIREEHEENAGDEPEEEIPLWPALGAPPGLPPRCSAPQLSSASVVLRSCGQLTFVTLFCNDLFSDPDQIRPIL
jgi:hypothetical protein